MTINSNSVRAVLQQFLPRFLTPPLVAMPFAAKALSFGILFFTLSLNLSLRKKLLKRIFDQTINASLIPSVTVAEHFV